MQFSEMLIKHWSDYNFFRDKIMKAGFKSKSDLELSNLTDYKLILDRYSALVNSYHFELEISITEKKIELWLEVNNLPHHLGYCVSLDRNKCIKDAVNDACEGLDGKLNPDKLYLMKNERNGYVKIGMSKKPEHRERTLQSQEPEVTLLWSSNSSYREEKNLHAHFSEKRLRGEWFDLSNDDIEYVKSLKWRNNG